VTALRDRYAGCLLGLAVGDAVGTTVEFRPRGSFEPLTDMVGGGPFGLKPGQWTDDTSMALCLAESLLTHSGPRRARCWRAQRTCLRQAWSPGGDVADEARFKCHLRHGCRDGSPGVLDLDPGGQPARAPDSPCRARAGARTPRPTKRGVLRSSPRLPWPIDSQLCTGCGASSGGPARANLLTAEPA